MHSGVLAGISAGAVLLLTLAVVIWWKRRHRSSLAEALAAIALDRIENVLVPDGMGGEIHIEHLLLTAAGILVIDIRRYEGTVFASDLMDPWTVMGPGGRSAFANPLNSLYDRIAAVRQLSRDLEVTGFVVFPEQADFSKGRPDSVRLPADLTETYALPADDEVRQLRDAFAPHWEQLKAAARPATL
jgi:hypothetical protein